MKKTDAMARLLHSPILYAALIVPSGTPDVEIIKFHLIEVQNQNKRLEVTSERADMYQKEKVSRLDSPVTQIWGQNETPYEITGSEGIIHSELQNLSLKKNCIVKSPDGTVFQTESLFYDHQASEIRSEEDVVAQRISKSLGDYVQMSGKGFLINVDTDEYQILSNVRAQRKQSGKKNLRILSDRSSIMPNRDLATFHGNVRVYSENLELNGDHLRAFLGRANAEGGIEKLELKANENSGRRITAKLEKINIFSQAIEIFFDENGSFNKMEAVGAVDAETVDGIKLRSEKLVYKNVNGKLKVLLRENVQIVTQDRTARCQEAEYIPETGDVLLERVATVKKGDQVLRGERIRFSTKNSQVFVEKASGEMLRQNLGF